MTVISIAPALFQQLTEESLPVISHGVTTITRTATVQEYFATKLTNYTADSGCGLEDVGRRSLGAGGCGQEGETNQCGDVEIEKQRKKKRKKVRTKR